MFKYPAGHMTCPAGALTWGLFKFSSRSSLFLVVADFIHAQIHPRAQHVHTGEVMREIHAAVVVNAERFSGCKSILIRSQEFKLPAVFVLLVFDAIIDGLRRVFVAGVLHAIGDDDAEDVLGTLRFFHVGKRMSDRVDGDADRIVERCAAGAVVLRHEVVVELCEVGGLDRSPDYIVELEEIEDNLAGFFALFLQELVERALDVVLDRAHGAGCIEDDDEVRIVFLHDCFSLLLFFCLNGVVGGVAYSQSERTINLTNVKARRPRKVPIAHSAACVGLISSSIFVSCSM